MIQVGEVQRHASALFAHWQRSHRNLCWQGLIEMDCCQMVQDMSPEVVDLLERYQPEVAYLPEHCCCARGHTLPTLVSTGCSIKLWGKA
jgi:hypothetical protein